MCAIITESPRSTADVCAREMCALLIWFKMYVDLGSVVMTQYLCECEGEKRE